MRIEVSAFDPAALDGLVARSLPQQGCVEIQRDAPGKHHAWHQHARDETLLILEGSLTFLHGDTQTDCRPGDAIFLPAGTRHASIAQDAGATYLIAFHTVELA